MSDWNGWSVQGANLVRGTHSIPLSYFATATQCLGYVEAFVRSGETDETIAGLVRAYCEMRGRK
jgi:hypothetical protein